MWPTALTALFAATYSTRWIPAASRPVGQPEHDAQEAGAEHRAEDVVVEEQLVEAVRREVERVARDLLAVVHRAVVHEHVAELHVPEAADERAVRVVDGVDLGVVTTVDRRPLAGPHAGGDPDDEAQRDGGGGLDGDGAVGDAAVEIDGGGEHGDLHDRDADHEGHEWVKGGHRRIVPYLPVGRGAGKCYGRMDHPDSVAVA